MSGKQLVPVLRFSQFLGHWIEKKLGSVVEIRSGDSPNKFILGATGKFPFVKVEDLNNCEKYQIDSREFTDSGNGVIPAGSIAFPKRGAAILNNKVRLTARPMFMDSNMMAITLISSSLNSEFLYHVICREKLSKIADTSSIPQINNKHILPYKIFFPSSFDESLKIAEFLSAVDKKISQLKEKYAVLQQYKKGVMQQIFTQQIRFKDDKGKAFSDWKVEPLGKQLQEYKAKSQTEREYEVFTSARTGLMKQSDYYSEGRITERDNEGFNIIPEGYMTYRSRSDDRQFYFNANTLGMTGIISTYYPVFKMINDQTDFFLELTRYYKNTFGRYAVGTSQVVLSFNELAKIKLQIPSTEEQKKIGDFAKVIDIKINLVAQQIEQTQQFKKGLLQQMFV